MAKRSVCLCRGDYIGIESIFSIINGKQINIPEKLHDLRNKSQNNELFCACGCGANVILVAGDRNLREQHFRLKFSNEDLACHFVAEGKGSIDSKIVLKCWLDEKLQSSDIETRVPIKHISDTTRKYEFSFLSLQRKIAVSYNYDRVNLSNEKLDILQSNSADLHLIYIVDIMNSGTNGQYPEALMKVQSRQKYCLFLDTNGISYADAKMSATFYAQDNDGLWQEVRFAEGLLSDYTIADDGQLLYKDEPLLTLLNLRTKEFSSSLQADLLRRREVEDRRREAAEQHRAAVLKRQEEYERQKAELQKRREAAEKERKEREAANQAEIQRREAEFYKNLPAAFDQQENQVRDLNGNRLIKCDICGKIGKTNEFPIYGGINRMNRGTCYACNKNKTSIHIPNALVPTYAPKEFPNKPKDYICPDCGGKLKRKNGPFGPFLGCSNFPKCTYSESLKK